MEEVKRNSWKIITIVICMLFVLSIGFNIYEFSKINKYNNNISKLNNEKQELAEKNDIKLKSNQDIENKIKELNDIDNVYLKTKEEVFKLASNLEKKIKDKDSKYKIAYLTFDDGPYYSTYRFLDTLHKYDVKATFFTTTINGQYCYDNKKQDCFKLYKEYTKDGHTIANHTYTHGIFKGLYNSTSSFMSAVNKQEEHIKKYADGYIPNILRFPGGSSQAGSKKSGIVAELRKKGYGYVDWTAQDGDGKGVSSTTEAWNTFVKSINDDIEVVLFHDYCIQTLNILPRVIEYLQGKNYILLPLFYDSVMVNK